MKVRTRFAPSPTGYLHLGGARTALFNYLYAKHHNGQFLLRIEDTDLERSSKEALDSILRSMKWLGLNWDEEMIFQSKNLKRHQEIAEKLVEQGDAYYCYLTEEELINLKEEQKNNPDKKVVSIWRDKNQKLENEKGVVRFKTPVEGKVIINDQVQGEVIYKAEALEDFVILRSDGTPTYMLSVVVDDHDMDITHIIRGDDHLNNTAKQILMYQALNWDIPIFAHIPLIHGADGSKLSKRHGATDASEYKKMGYLPEALNNCLLRLGWSNGNKEIISIDEAIKLFDIKDINKGAARLDKEKLDHINFVYIKEKNPHELFKLLKEFLPLDKLNEQNLGNIRKAIMHLQPRCSNLVDMAEKSMMFCLDQEVILQEDGLVEKQTFSPDQINKTYEWLINQENWIRSSLFSEAKKFAETINVKVGFVSSIIRIALVGSTSSPSVFDIAEIIGKEETLKRYKEIYQL